MKIIEAVGWYLPDTLGGTEVYVAALARRFREAGHEVLIAAPQPGLTNPRTYAHDGVPVFRYPIPESPTRAEAQGRVRARGSEHLDAWLAAQQPAVVHMHTFVTGLGVFELEAARQVARRVVVTSHSSALGFLCQRGTLMFGGQEPCDKPVTAATCVPCALHTKGVPTAVGRILAHIPPSCSEFGRVLPGKPGSAVGMAALIEHQLTLQQRVIEAIDYFVVLTEVARQRVIAHGAPPERVVLNRLGHALGADERPALARDCRPVRVCYVGRLDPIKGVLDLARACAELPADVAIGVDFIGPVQDDESRAARDAIVRMGGEDPRIRVLPPVPHEAIASTLRQYDAICCPARCHEGGPTVALEAMALKVPVIGTRIGALAELICDDVNGALVAPGDSHALARVLARVVASPRQTLHRWREHLGATRTLDDVARDYLELFA